MELLPLLSRLRAPRVIAFLRSLLMFAAGLYATYWFAERLDPIYPLRHWLTFSIAGMWGYEALLSAGLLSSGYLLLRRVFRIETRSSVETVSLSAGAGAVVFAMGMYAGGFLGLYGPVFAVTLPLFMLLAGLPWVAPAVRRARAARRTAPPPSALALVATAFGTLCLGVLYLGIFTPDAVNYDASWNHLVIAQDYAREGRIVPFPADWVKNVPHLGSIFNTWSFLVPGLDVAPLRWMMALHTEFTFFLFTLVGVAAMIEWLARRSDLRGTWAFFFLFPAIFVYDSNIGGAADHFLAFFVPPLCLAAVRAFERFEPRPAILVGMIAAGAISTKLHAFYVLGPLVLAGAFRLGLLTIRRLRRKPEAPVLARMLVGISAGAISSLVFASPHYLKNWVYYKNPFYPLAQRHFPESTPAISDAALFMDYLFADWRWHPPEDLGERMKAALEMVFSFSFTPHYSFIRDLPVHGSLFPLALAFLPFLRGAGRLWLGTLIAAGALFFWASTFWVDRNLQTFEPLLVAVAGGTLAAAWTTGWFARVGVAALVLLQFAWGADFYFSGTDRFSSAFQLIKSGMDGRAPERFRHYRSNYIELGQSLPKDATVLLHTQHVMLGIDRRVYLDWMGFQGLIDYRTMKTPRDVYERFREVGISHVVQIPRSRRTYTKQEEVLFDTFVAFYAENRRNIAGLEVFPLPATAPPVEAPFTVLSSGLPGYADGLYPIDSLGVCEGLPAKLQTYPRPSVPLGAPAEAAELLRRANAALIANAGALDAEAQRELSRLVLVSSYPGLWIYARRP